MYVCMYVCTQGPATIRVPLSELDYQTACSLDPEQTLISHVNRPACIRFTSHILHRASNLCLYVYICSGARERTRRFSLARCVAPTLRLLDKTNVLVDQLISQRFSEMKVSYLSR